MELPFSTQGRKATHDFLSLYSSSSSHVQDPPPPQGGYLKTHNFLQPLERVGKTAMASKEEGTHEMAAVEKPPTSVEQLLPGGIGTYTISYFNQSTTRHDDNSSSSYQGSGFTLWDESSSVNKGKTGKENILTDTQVVPGRQWASSSQKKQSFMEMIASAKNDQDDDDDEEEDEFVIKKETSFSSHQKGNLLIKVEAQTVDQKPNTPRSKHSATEQRRRSKINDRFQKLREVIPKVDQKKDKASFLLEVIEYIQLLQEKVNRYETSYDLWSHEPSKMMQWRKCNIADGLVDHLPVANSPALVDTNNPGASPSTANESGGRQPELASRATPVHPTMQPNILALGRTGFPTSPVSPKQASNTDQTMAWHPSQFHQKRPPTIESGTINISSAYSLGLLNSLTQALSKSGVDLSQASISVKIDLQDKASGIPQFSSPAAKDNGGPAAATHARATKEDFTNALKKLRTS